MCGYPPFRGTNDFMIFRKIEKGSFTFPTDNWSTASAESKDFIKKLLTLNPDDRITAKDAIQHPWFKKFYKLANLDFINLLDNKNINHNTIVTIEDVDTLSQCGVKLYNSVVCLLIKHC